MDPQAPAPAGAPHPEKPPLPRLDAEGGPALITLERLKSYPLFSKLSDTVLNKLVLHVREERFPKGTVILRAGSYTKDAYYVVEGSVEICLPKNTSKAAVRPSPSRAADPGLISRLAGMLGFARPKVPPEAASPPAPAAPARARPSADETVVLMDLSFATSASERNVLQPGETFGESAALSRYPISTDVIAQTDTLCLLISGFALSNTIKKDVPEFYKSVYERYRSTTLGTHLRQISLFSSLADDVIARIVEKAEFVAFDPELLLRAKEEQREEAKRKLMAGVRIAEQGSAGDALYLVVGGHVKVSVRAGAADLAVTYLRKGDYAGELCLLLDEPWPFSLSALEHVEVVKITRALIEEVLAGSPDAQKQLWATAVKRLKQRGFALRNPQASRTMQMAMDTGLIHGESVLLIDLNTCTRCDDCVRACAQTHDGMPRFVREGLRYEQWNIVTACYQCSDPVCMVNCPTGAITRALGTLEVTIQDDICVGCEACAKSCPWDNIVMMPNLAPADFIKSYTSNKTKKVLDPTSAADNAEWETERLARKPLQKFINLATKCDLCVDRRDGPACVQMCPHGSAVRVSFKDLETVVATLNRS
jgi:CRP-like cAMP-binding protein/Fe-S-cluster-containing hydrogenase component 2